MKVLLTLFFLNLLSVSALLANDPHIRPAAPPPKSSQRLEKRAAGRILVKAKNGVGEHLLKTLFASLDAHQARKIPQIAVRILHVPEAKFDGILTALQNNPNIEFAEPDLLLSEALVPNDPYFSQAWHLPKIQAPQAWDMSTGSPNTIVAILDSGVDETVSELIPLYVPGYNFIHNDSDTGDFNGHGTAVAATVGAVSNNSSGIASICWQCRIMPIRMAASNSGYSSAMAEGLVWAAVHGSRVANISYANITKITTVNAAASYFQSVGGVVTASAGNESVTDATADNPLFLMIGATQTDDTLATFSNRGNNIDLVAPGVNVIVVGVGGGVSYFSGTSAAAPVVAGVLGLMFSANSNLNATDMQNIVKANADDLGTPGWDSNFGTGRVNAFRALSAAIQLSKIDSIPPAIGFVNPIDDSGVSGTMTIGAVATDNSGSVSGVQFKLDDLNFGAEDTTSPYERSWDTSQVSPGLHSLKAVARDASGNTASTVISITVDNAAPTLSSVASTNITTTSAQISWATNEPCDQQVEYGRSTSYGNLSPYSLIMNLNTSLTTNHSITLTGLASGTLYHYRVTSKDIAGHSLTSSDFSFTTSAVTPVGSNLRPQVIWEKPGHTVKSSAVSAAAIIAFSSDGTLIATGSRDKLIKLWRVTDGILLNTFVGHRDDITTLAFSPDGTILASGSADAQVKFWSVADGSFLGALPLTSAVQAINSLAFSPDSSMLAIAVGTANSSVGLWRVSDKSFIRKFTTTGTQGLGQANSIAFSSDGNMLVAGYTGTHVAIWKVSDGTLLQRLIGHTAAVRSVVFSPNMDFVVSGSDDLSAKQWRVSDGQLLQTFTCANAISSLALTLDGVTLLTNEAGFFNNNALKLWHIVDGTLLKSFQETSTSKQALFTPDGTRIGYLRDDTQLVIAINPVPVLPPAPINLRSG